jgi:hypothetical protein
VTTEIQILTMQQLMGTIQGMYPMMVMVLTETYHTSSVNKRTLCDSVKKTTQPSEH